MNILAIDTATDILSIALETNQGTWFIESDAGLHHSERLISMVDTLLIQSGTNKQDLNLLACMEGPGSFTGLRIGFATVKGMALALSIPFIAIPTLDCMAYGWEFWPGSVIPVIDAKKNCYFWAIYSRGHRISDYMDAPITDIVPYLASQKAPLPLLMTGSDATDVQELMVNNQLSPISPDQIVLDSWHRKGKAKELLVLAKKRFTIEGRGSSDSSGPVYIRKSDAELSRGVE
ncbi:tRNA (adenosine(37)-N6)-threonylcarbamoyltransferase complex dimerization subunit type 1 TsaB [Gracilinema caldarium]|uniref:Universal protein YeaZ n=1 Tax=Gracilinema caldarium (strain ATCC 51460 / DSM 7334 / H1) TaxID=744872 RepID=F8EZ35_GRAC1|nr:tRNA (adenosine(37)-N6)-threonylcarbamoyltransferase complex dimerization subunit type 1 TsaB [Gracilinema caldarium]AEJ19266.1 universal protein YeaZ [Gracilinema caldarium DSM 7334]